MRLLIAGIDSDIGKALADQAKLDSNNVVVTTSRNKKANYNLELNHPFSWPKFTEQFDRVYYTIGIGESRASRMEVMQTNCFATLDFLNNVSRNVVDGGKIIILSSEWGSITRCDSTASQWYRMSKAALNMGIAVASKRHSRLNWMLMQPGFVNTKMTSSLKVTASITPQMSAIGILSVAESNDKQFSFVDYQGLDVPF